VLIAVEKACIQSKCSAGKEVCLQGAGMQKDREKVAQKQQRDSRKAIKKLKTEVRRSIGYEAASQLFITAGDNSERLHSEASFAALCGSSPVTASSGQRQRYRLDRGGDRAANGALHITAIGRIRRSQKLSATPD